MKTWKLRESQQLRPFGGHHFKDHGVTFTGDTLDEVVKKLEDHRINNALPVGNPKQDVLRYYAVKWPFMVDDDYTPPKPEKPNVLMERWVRWVRKYWGKSLGRMVTSHEAAARWDICMKCPHNIKLDPSSREEKEMQRKAFLMRAGQDIPKELGFCSLHWADTTVSVWAEAPVKVSEKPKDLVNYPGCWVA